MAQKSIDDERLTNDLDHRIDECVSDCIGNLQDYHDYSEERAHGYVADVLERWLDQRSASDWF